MDARRGRDPISEQAFLAWAAPRDARCELVEGAIAMQAGATRDHERVDSLK